MNTKFRSLVLAFTLLTALLASCGGGGSSVVDISKGSHRDAWPSWSPDGHKIAFLGDDVNFGNIYIMDADGSNRTKVLDSNHRSFKDLAWSPDGTRIAFAVMGGVATCALDGSDFTYIVPPAIGEQSQGLSWSSDGSKIAFAATSAGWDIYVVDADGGNEVKLSSQDTEDRSPSWSPEGSKIVFNALTHTGGGRWNIYVMDADGSDRTRLTDDEGLVSDRCPVWSPDGSRIAFISDRYGYPQIYLMDADGGNVIRLTETSTSVESLAWSPDGTRIAFAASSMGSPESIESHIYIVAVLDEPR